MNRFMRNFPKIILFIISLICFNPAKADTIDFWTIYLNNKRAYSMNANDSLIVSPELKAGDTLTFIYQTDTEDPHEVLLYFQHKNGITGWNDGGYYSDQSQKITLVSIDDPDYWELSYAGHNKVSIPVSDLLAYLKESEAPLYFYLTCKNWRERNFGSVFVFGLSAENVTF